MVVRTRSDTAGAFGARPRAPGNADRAESSDVSLLWAGSEQAASVAA